jgi:hypothetical protein
MPNELLQRLDYFYLRFFGKAILNFIVIGYRWTWYAVQRIGGIGIHGLEVENSDLVGK